MDPDAAFGLPAISNQQKNIGVFALIARILRLRLRLHRQEAAISHFKSFSVVLALGICTAISSCTWVKPTAEGQSVQVADAHRVANCERRGKVTVSLKDKIGWMDRKRAKVETELETLARNEGALLGGNTVSAESEIQEGRQVFGVYKCPM